MRLRTHGRRTSKALPDDDADAKAAAEEELAPAADKRWAIELAAPPSSTCKAAEASARLTVPYTHTYACTVTCTAKRACNDATLRTHGAVTCELRIPYVRHVPNRLGRLEWETRTARRHRRTSIAPPDDGSEAKAAPEEELAPVAEKPGAVELAVPPSSTCKAAECECETHIL